MFMNNQIFSEKLNSSTKIFSIFSKPDFLELDIKLNTEIENCLIVGMLQDVRGQKYFYYSQSFIDSSQQ